MSGFTLVELVMIIVVLGILATFAVAKFSDMAENSKIQATKTELSLLRKAIIGNAQIVAGGKYIDVGFEGNVGLPPCQLTDLVTKPDSVPAYNKISGLGWLGPYIDPSNNEYLSDAWGTAYVYDQAGRTIKSVGSGQDIVVSF